MSLLYYFAYGSNLHPLRLKERVPSSQLIGPVKLHGYQLHFHTIGQDLSGKCNIVHTGDDTEVVYGALFSLLAAEKTLLDAFEGAGYRIEELSVMHEGSTFQSFVYLANSDYIDHTIMPYHWYKDIVALGANYQNFPAEYIKHIANFASEQDTDVQRNKKHHELIARMRLEM